MSDTAASPKTPDQIELERTLIAIVRVGLPVLTLGGGIAAGWYFGPPMAVLVFAGGALVGVIAYFWASVRTLVGETPLSAADAYAMAAPRAEEEQKRAVLRALKDLEYERGLGKISDADYAVLVAKYRAEAKRLLKQLDEETAPRRKDAEALLEKRLRREGLAEKEAAEPSEPADGGTEAAAPKEEPKKLKTKKAKNPKPKEEPAELAEEPGADAAKATNSCSACGTPNDADAVFCKRCGARQKAAEADAEEDEA